MTYYSQRFQPLVWSVNSIWVVGGVRSSGITINGVKKTVRDAALKLLSDEWSEEFSERSGSEKVFNR